MNISDLNHFQEVVSEATTIVGGGVTTKTSTGTQLASNAVNELPEDLRKLLLGYSGSVKSSIVVTPNASSTSTTATLNQGKDQIKVSASNSTAKVVAK